VATFDLLISKSNQFIFVSDCTEVVNSVKFSQAIYKILCSQTFSINDHARRDVRKQDAHGEGINIKNTQSSSLILRQLTVGMLVYTTR